MPIIPAGIRNSLASLRTHRPTQPRQSVDALAVLLGLVLLQARGSLPGRPVGQLGPLATVFEYGNCVPARISDPVDLEDDHRADPQLRRKCRDQVIPLRIARLD